MAALRDSARARYVRARALDAAAEARRDNALLSKAIGAYLELLKMNERLSDQRLKEIGERTLDRIRFRGMFHFIQYTYIHYLHFIYYISDVIVEFRFFFLMIKTFMSFSGN